jgi:hypothetical protein
MGLRAEVERRRIGRVTIDRRPDALVVTAPFLSRGRSAVLAVTIVALFIFLGTLAFGAPGPRRTLDYVGMIVVFGGCGYAALILALNRTVTTIRRDRIVIRRGPIPMWPATTFDAARVEHVRAAVATGIVGRGGRMALDCVNASLAGGGTVNLVDDAGDSGDAAQVAAAITEWLWAHRA